MKISKKHTTCEGVNAFFEKKITYIEEQKSDISQAFTNKRQESEIKKNKLETFVL